MWSATAPSMSRTGSKWAASYLIVGETVAAEEDLGLHLDTGLDLDLPLVGDRHRGGCDPVEQVSGRGSFAKQPAIRAVVGQPIAALGGADDRAAGADDFSRRGHPLHGLVEVLVERVAAVRGDDDVERRIDGPHGLLARDGTRGGVHGERLPSERARDLFRVVKEDVEREVHAGRPSDRTDGVVDGIAIDHTPRRLRIADATGVVKGERGSPDPPGPARPSSGRR